MKGARDVFQVTDLNAGMYFVRIDYKGVHCMETSCDRKIENFEL